MLLTNFVLGQSVCNSHYKLVNKLKRMWQDAALA